MKRLFLGFILILLSCLFLQGQTVLTYEGQTYNNTETPVSYGVNVPRSTPTTFTFRNNQLNFVNLQGYMLQAGDEGISSYNNNLKGELIIGNKFNWNGDFSGLGTAMTITHGLFTGCNIDVNIKYNYLSRVPMGIIRKSASNMVNTTGGVSYNIIKTFNVGGVVKGMSNVNWYNNTFYNDRPTYSSTDPTAGTWRGAIDVYTNTDVTPNSVAHGTKIKNNIFYSKYKTLAIDVMDTESLVGFECDYNVYWVEEGDHKPVFNAGGSTKTWDQWRAMGYDQHSVVMNPNFIDFVNFVPTARLDYGTNLGTEFNTGLAINSTWTVGVSPATQVQNGTWQVGARVYAPVAPPQTIFYLSPSGNDNTGDGTITKPWFTLNKAWTSVSAGCTIYMRGGTYNYLSQQRLTGKNGTYGNEIKILPYQSEIPVITRGNPFTYPGWPHALVYLTADYVQIKGIDISGFTQVNNGDMWEPLRIYGCNYCTFELLNIHHNGAGMQLTNSNQCIVKNSDFHHNQDPLTTSAGAYGNADGMGVDGTNPNAINYVYGCRFWYNSDDGIDTWAEEGMVYIENCWSFWNGFIPDTWNVGGDGNGFKLGITAASSPTVVKRKLTNNIAFQNKKWGFLDNGLKCNAEIYNNTAYQNGYKGLDSWSGGFNFTTTTEATKYYIKNNIAYGNSDNADVGDVTNINHNTWDLSVTVNDADFVSLSTTGLDGSRQPDGSLPTTTFLHLAQGSDLIDKGISVGLPFNGTAPDLGAYETNYGPITPTSPYYISATGNDNTGNGTINSPWFTLNKAWSYVKAGETIYVRGGVYKYDVEQFLTNKSGTAENYIKVFAYQDEVPIINPSTSYTGNVGITVENVSYVHIKGLDVSQYTQRTSDDWYNGIIAADANYCIFEELNVHHNGFGMSLGRWTTGDPVTGNVFLNCDFHHNYDPITAITTNVPYGGSDGLTIRVDNPNSVNTIIGCRFWNNSDDGFDGWYNAGFLLFENCWSFNNGYREDGVTEGGDGNGFKMGPLVAPPWTGYETEHKRTMQNCIAFNNRVNGFDQNASLCVMHFYNCTAFGNGNHGFLMNNNSAIQMIARNNISYRNAKGSAYFTAVSTVDHNTFTYNNGVNTNYSVSDADFLSISPLGSDGPRQSNGNLPDILFLKLSNGSDLINGGVDVGLPYKGSAPDLGSFETEDTSPVIVKAIISNGYTITTQGSKVTTNK